MKIEIVYELHTDGDYSLDNPDYFGCTGRNVKTEYDDFYDYIGSKTFEDKDETTCRILARNFLAKFLCDGIHVSYTHFWLLEYFYNMITCLMEEISKGFKEDKKQFFGEISGNQEGTKIIVTISK